LLPTFDSTKKNQEKKEKNTKRKSKIQKDIHEESLEDCPRLVVEDQDDKWKSWMTKMYKIDKIDNPILIDKRLHW
jgi:hypothetical protein